MTPSGREERLQALSEDSLRWLKSDLHRHALIAAEMMELAEEAGPVGRALALRVHGNHLRMEGRLPEALTVLRRALRLSQAARADVEWARIQIGIIPVLVQLGRHKAAIRAAEEGLAVLLAHEQYLPAARLLNNTAAMYGNMGRPTDALRCLDRGEKLAARTPDRGLEARMLLTRALLLQQLGRHRESVAASARALRHARRYGEQVFAARATQAGAIALFHLGQFGKALRRFARARGRFARVASPRDVAVCDLYLCHCYVELNRFDQALARVQAVVNAPDSPLTGFQHASARMYEGVTLARLKRREEALRALGEACNWFERHGHSPWAGRGHLEEADLYLAQGDARAAARAAARAGKLFSTAEMPVEKARAALLEAEAHLLAHRTAQAERAVTGAYETFRRARMPGPAFRCLQLLGRIALIRRDREAARRWLTRAVRTAEEMRATVQVSFRQTFLDDKAGAYADLVWLHLSEGRVQAAHRLADRATARALADRLAFRPRHRRGFGTRPADQELWAAIEAARKQYQELLLPAQLGPEEAAVLAGGVGSLTARRAQAEAHLTSLWDEWELRQTASMGIIAGGVGGALILRNYLPAGARLVEYFVAGAHVIAFVSDRRGLQGWVDLGSSEPVRRALELLQLNLDAVLANIGLAEPPGLARNARALLCGLYQRIWRPLLPLLGDCRQAVIIPHGIIHQIPFEALDDGERCLVQKMELSLAPSRQAWALCCDRARVRGSCPDLVAGFDAGGALPYVPEEVRQVAAALQAEPWLGAEATGARLAAAGARRVIHLAVHGEFRPDNPNFSTLLLADGPFTVADAASLRLHADLVVLSGCETGLSQITPGAELQGMIAAVLLAGSASVLASRWRVDDRVTAGLMQRFYDGLLAGRGKAAALREAQAEMAEQGIHPLYWAAFCLVGDSGPLGSAQPREGEGI